MRGGDGGEETEQSGWSEKELGMYRKTNRQTYDFFCYHLLLASLKMKMYMKCLGINNL
jgi:hypothetical protein